MTNQLRAGAPLAVGEVFLIPVERMAVRVESRRHGHWFSGTKEVVAVVVCESGSLRVIDVQARELPVDELVNEIPCLAAVIGKCLSA